MELNSLKRFAHVLGKSRLAVVVQSPLVIKGAVLMKFSKKHVEFINSVGISHKSVPVVRARNRRELSLELVHDFREVPRERENV
jgi:hypothetical protein